MAVMAGIDASIAADNPTSERKSDWPAVTATMKPWAYNWWPGSAVDRQNITRELERCKAAGLGGIHIIPIYGAKGAEERYISYLSPKWMELLDFTVTEAKRLGMGVDMTLGTGWCFGGPNVPAGQACMRPDVKVFEVAEGKNLSATLRREALQALVAHGPNGKTVDLLDRVEPSGAVAWKADGGAWTVYAVSGRATNTPVKRAALGGEGQMLNPFYGKAIDHYLVRFSDAFAGYKGAMPRAVYQDSYEYQSQWSPDLFAEFQRRRGYRLQEHLPELFGRSTDDLKARVKCDYRETVSDMMTENFMPPWVNWAHEHGMLTRDQAHGSPGNLLDLYAAADMPETEMFCRDREMLVCKFASSAGHVAGRKLISSETGTWLAEHFTETLGEMKQLIDEMFLSGINHVFYHGMCYSPDDAAWPGWLFYAATEMNPRNPIWHDVPALNAYIARCQSFLQAGRPDSDILLYWPIHDLWNDPNGMVQPLTVHHRDWLDKQPLGKTARQLWNRGYAFDYVSDRQIARNVTITDTSISAGNGEYRTIVIPPCTFMPLETLQILKKLAAGGATIIFQDQLPKDVPGMGHLEERRRLFKDIIEKLGFRDAPHGVRAAQIKEGYFLVGELQAALDRALIPGETLVDQGGLLFERRAIGREHCYFICNHGTRTFDGWITPTFTGESTFLMDPMTGQCSTAATRRNAQGRVEIRLQLPPAGSIILRTDSTTTANRSPWRYWQQSGEPIALAGKWNVEFIEGGPSLPKSYETLRPASWTESGDEEAKRFAGTARYRIEFDAPKQGSQFRLDLGKVCQSARVRLNGKELGTLLLAPYQVVINDLKPRANILAVEVTNVAANRIRDLDRRHVVWRIFHDINFASIDYKKFDASNWPICPSGLLGPVTLQPITTTQKRSAGASP
jgi:hypothetical protein